MFVFVIFCTRPFCRCAAMANVNIAEGTMVVCTHTFDKSRPDELTLQVRLERTLPRASFFVVDAIS